MKLGAVSSALLHLDFESGLDRLKALGLDAIEIACGGVFENGEYGDPGALVRDNDACERWQEAFKSRGLEISALAIHGFPLSPDTEVARGYDDEFRVACELAEMVGVTRLTLFAGLPEGRPGDQTPCWVVSAWPPNNSEILRYQWEERVLPYWHEHAEVARSHDVRLCFEMHPSDVLHNPRTLLRLRNEVGETVGCNFDPSHLFWQGIDPIEALHAVGPAIYHAHAKDTGINERVARVNGLLDATPFERFSDRGWNFRTVGYGHDTAFWRAFVSELRTVGYDDVLSIEHEDFSMDLSEGLEKAVAVLREVSLRKSPGRSSFDLSAARSEDAPQHPPEEAESR